MPLLQPNSHHVLAQPNQESWVAFSERAEKHPETLTPEEKEQIEGIRQTMTQLSKAFKTINAPITDSIKKLMQEFAPVTQHYTDLGKSVSQPVQSWHDPFSNGVTDEEIEKIVAEAEQEREKDAAPGRTFTPWFMADKRVHVSNLEDVRYIVANEMHKALRLKRQQERAAKDNLVEYIPGLLRVLDYTFSFDGLRDEVVEFFVNDPGRGSWRSYHDIREFLEHPNLKAAAIRQAIYDINERVAKETEDAIKELVQSRPRTDKSNSELESRFAPSRKKR